MILNEKEIILDMLITQKYMSKAYCSSALESIDKQLKNCFIAIQEDEQLAENELFDEMQKRNLYSSKNASKNDIKSVKDNFSENKEN